VGAHYPFTSRSFINPTFFSTGKPLWASECWNLGVYGDWNGAGVLAQMINGNYNQGKMTGAVIWNLIYSWFSILPFSRPVTGTVGGEGHSLMYATEPWSGYYSIQPPIYVVAHTTQFTKPGWNYINTNLRGILKGGGDYVALVSPDGKDLSIIVQTIGAQQAQTAWFNISNAQIRSLHTWSSNETNWFINIGDVFSSNNVFQIDLLPNTVYTFTTTTGQGKAPSLPVPSSKPFPFPYSDNFNSYKPEATVKYFSDQGGSWNAAVSPTDQTNGVFKQVVAQPPIPWSTNIPPVTIIGNSQDWKDYTVRAKVYCTSNGQGDYVAVFGRISTFNTFSTSWPPGYGFLVFPSGKYELVYGKDGASSPQVLHSGSVSYGSNSWHTLEIIFNGANIRVRLDSQDLISGGLQDNSVNHGMAAIGSGFNIAYFDDFEVVQ